MNVGIYKPGQGYWVRVLTAIFAGVLVLTGATWAWAQATRYRPPTPTWNVGLVAIEGSLTPGVQVDIYDIADTGPVLVGTAVADSYTTGEARTGDVVLSSIQMQGDSALVTASRIVVEDIVGQDSEAFSAQIRRGSAIGIPAFEVIYVQAAIAGTIMLIGAVLVFYFVGTKRRTVDFLIATDGEMKKVNWSTRKEVQGSTVVVVIASMLLAMTIFVVDYGFGAFFKLIGVLQG
ncbi:MAG: preprotein translocase subunit SecE [Phycisphaerales bacterium JB061]